MPITQYVDSIALFISEFLTIYHIPYTIYEKCRETTFLDLQGKLE